MTNQCGFIDQKPLWISTSSTVHLFKLCAGISLDFLFPLHKQRKMCTKEDKSYPCPSLSSCHQIWSQHGLHPHRSWRNHWGMFLTSDLQTRTDSGFSMIVRKKKQKRQKWRNTEIMINIKALKRLLKQPSNNNKPKRRANKTHSVEEHAVSNARLDIFRPGIARVFPQEAPRSGLAVVGIQATELRLWCSTVLHAAVTCQDAPAKSVDHVLLWVHAHLQEEERTKRTRDGETGSVRVQKVSKHNRIGFWFPLYVIKKLKRGLNERIHLYITVFGVYIYYISYIICMYVCMYVCR